MARYTEIDTGSEAQMVRRGIRAGAALVLLIVAFFASFSMFEYVSASEIVGISYPNGSLVWYTQQGPVLQFFGRITTYPKRGQLKFTATKKADGTYETDGDGRIKIGFNDGGDGKILGSLNYEMPLDTPSLNKIHAAYPSIEALEGGLLRPALNQTIFLTGQLMSSHESYRERRTQIVQYVEDQVQNGIYQTRARIISEPAATGSQQLVEGAPVEQRQRTVSEIVKDEKGLYARAGGGEVSRFHVRTYNFAIEDLDYSDTVDRQIATQQQITMAVETAVAKAREAQQNEITAGAEGRANAEKIRQVQNAENAKLIAAAEGKKLSAEQDKLAAEAEKQAMILRAQGEAEARRLAVAADNALERRLGALVQIHQAWAGAAAQVKVPSTVIGSAGNAGNAVATMQDYMSLATAKLAKDIGAEAGVK